MMSFSRGWIGALAFCSAALLQDASAQQLASPPAWSAAVRAAVDQDPALRALTPGDIALYCPAYATLGDDGRDAFWTNLMVQIATAESDGDLARTRWFALDPAIHRPAFRRGLFQISIEAAHSARYNCSVGAGADLTGAEASAACAVRIVENTIGASNEIAAGGRYWPSLSHAARRARIAAATSSQSPCAPTDAQP